MRGYYLECIKRECLKRDFFIKSYENWFKSYCDFGLSRISSYVVVLVVFDDFYCYFFYGVKYWNFCIREEDIGFVFIMFRLELSLYLKGYFR